MFNVRLAGGRLCGRWLFTWLSLVVSFMASFVLSFFPLDVLGGIWDLIESVSEGFLTYSYAQGQGHNEVRGQIVPKIVLLTNYRRKFDETPRKDKA